MGTGLYIQVLGNPCNILLRDRSNTMGTGSYGRIYRYWSVALGRAQKVVGDGVGSAGRRRN